MAPLNLKPANFQKGINKLLFAISSNFSLILSLVFENALCFCFSVREAKTKKKFQLP